MDIDFYPIEGNAARVPERLPAPAEEPQVSPRPRVLPKKKRRAVNLAYMVTLTAVTLLLGWLCFSYLSLHASINASLGRISSLEDQLAEMKQDNFVLENRLDAQLDLEEVYRIATEELGMVYPDGNERILYNEQVRELVRQYDDIPTD